MFLFFFVRLFSLKHKNPQSVTACLFPLESYQCLKTVASFRSYCSCTSTGCDKMGFWAGCCKIVNGSVWLFISEVRLLGFCWAGKRRKERLFFFFSLIPLMQWGRGKIRTAVKSLNYLLVIVAYLTSVNYPLFFLCRTGE